MNLIEKYLAKAAGLEEVRPGMDVTCKVGYVAAHDAVSYTHLDVYKRQVSDKTFEGILAGFGLS